MSGHEEMCVKMLTEVLAKRPDDVVQVEITWREHQDLRMNWLWPVIKVQYRNRV